MTPGIAAVATFFGWRAIVNNRSIARQKATLDLIEKRESTEHYRLILARFSELRKGPGFAHLNTPQDDQARDDRLTLIGYLNHYELVSIGLRQGILDERFYRAWMEGSFVRDWNAVAPWVERERWQRDSNGRWQYRASIYQHYETMARRWSKEAIQLQQTMPPVETSSAEPAFPEPVDTVVLKD